MSKIPFNVDAYTAKLIGRENVSKLDGAVLELVKNTYDADASICFLYYEKDTDTLYIGDNGVGMTESVILKHWMTIGGSSKKNNFKSKHGRVQTGAKGIGRFALDRIADSCSLLTISEEEHLLWNVDWTVFEFGKKITDITADLNKVDISFVDFLQAIKNKAVLELIKDKFKSTGSIFKLNNLRDNWSKDTIESITNNLRTLIPPEFKQVFNIYFFAQDTFLKEASLLQDSDAFPYDYRIKFEAFSNGNVKVEINREEFDFGNDFKLVMKDADFKNEEIEYFKGKPIIINTNFSEVLDNELVEGNPIGDFSGILYFAKISCPKSERKKYYYKDITGRIDIRDSFGGVRIYRDGFRVRPYGDPKSTSVDWLLLSLRKNKSPAAISHPTGAWRVNSDQIHGSIYISRLNVSLPDQANREGIVETKEFLQLQHFLQNIIRLFERDRQYVCRKLDKYYKKTHHTEEIKKELKEKLILSENKQKENGVSLDKKNSEYMEVNKVSALVEEKEMEIKQLETELQMLRVLATTGIVTNTYIHEIKGITHKLNMKIVATKDALELDRDIDAGIRNINDANDIRKSFTSWFKVTVESVRRDKRSMKKVEINELIEALLNDWSLALKGKGIIINRQIDVLTFKCFPYEIESILTNLIANSASVFDERRYSSKEINIEIKNIEEGMIINYFDNGKGLCKKYQENPNLILEAFETDKKTTSGEAIGTGMGMWIINRIVNDYHGVIDLTKNINSSQGFYISITLKNR